MKFGDHPGFAHTGGSGNDYVTVLSTDHEFQRIQELRQFVFAPDKFGLHDRGLSFSLSNDEGIVVLAVGQLIFDVSQIVANGFSQLIALLRIFLKQFEYDFAHRCWGIIANSRNFGFAR